MILPKLTQFFYPCPQLSLMVPTPALEPGAVQEFYQHTKVPDWQIRSQNGKSSRKMKQQGLNKTHFARQEHRAEKTGLGPAEPKFLMKLLP